MEKEKKIKWNFGDVFIIPLKNGKFSIGQILDLQMPNIVRVALFDEILENSNSVDLQTCCNLSNLVSLLACSREQLDYSAWKIIGSKPIQVPENKFPNENFRKYNWIGAKHYDAALIEDFLNSFYALLPWDDWFNPNYLDQFLININKKPLNLIYKKTQ